MSLAKAFTGRHVALRSTMRSSKGMIEKANSGGGSREGEVKMDVGGEDDGDMSVSREVGKATFDRKRLRREDQCAACEKTRTQASGTIYEVYSVTLVDE